MNHLHEQHQNHHQLEKEDLMVPAMSIGMEEKTIEHESFGSESSSSMSMMKMYFHFGLGDQVLFSNFSLDSKLKLCLTCLIIFMLSIMLEALKSFRNLKCKCEMRQIFCDVHNNKSPPTNHNHHETTHCNQQSRLCCSGAGGRDAIVKSHCQLGLFQREKRAYKFAQAILHFTCTTLSFALMLVVMTYNVCLIFSIVLGKFKNKAERVRENKNTC